MLKTAIQATKAVIIASLITAASWFNPNTATAQNQGDTTQTQADTTKFKFMPKFKFKFKSKPKTESVKGHIGWVNQANGNDPYRTTFNAGLHARESWGKVSLIQKLSLFTVSKFAEKNLVAKPGDAPSQVLAVNIFQIDELTLGGKLTPKVSLNMGLTNTTINKSVFDFNLDLANRVTFENGPVFGGNLVQAKTKEGRSLITNRTLEGKIGMGLSSSFALAFSDQGKVGMSSNNLKKIMSASIKYGQDKTVKRTQYANSSSIGLSFTVYNLSPDYAGALLGRPTYTGGGPSSDNIALVTAIGAMEKKDRKTKLGKFTTSSMINGAISAFKLDGKFATGFALDGTLSLSLQPKKLQGVNLDANLGLIMNVASVSTYGSADRFNGVLLLKAGKTLNLSKNAQIKFGGSAGLVVNMLPLLQAGGQSVKPNWMLGATVGLTFGEPSKFQSKTKTPGINPKIKKGKGVEYYRASLGK